MSSHFVEICRNGFVHAQCRCPSNDKQVRKITCDEDSHKYQLGPHWKEVS